MLSKVVILAVSVILAAPICAATSGSNSTGGNSTGAGASGHNGGGGEAGGGGGGHGGGANGSGGLGGRAAAAAAHSGVDGHELSSRAGISHTDAMHATHLAGGKLSEGERTTSKHPSMDHHHHPYRREPHYATNRLKFPSCIPAPETQMMPWFDCNRPTKSLAGHKS